MAFHKGHIFNEQMILSNKDFMLDLDSVDLNRTFEMRIRIFKYILAIILLLLNPAFISFRLFIPRNLNILIMGKRTKPYITE